MSVSCTRDSDLVEEVVDEVGVFVEPRHRRDWFSCSRYADRVRVVAIAEPGVSVGDVAGRSLPEMGDSLGGWLLTRRAG